MHINPANITKNCNFSIHNILIYNITININYNSYLYFNTLFKIVYYLRKFKELFFFIKKKSEKETI